MYKRRLKVFLVLAVLAVVVLAARLAHLQGTGGAEYRRQAAEMLASVEFLPTVRGQVLDRAGRVLAVDEACYDFCLDYPLLTGNPSKRWLAQQAARIMAEERVSKDQAREILSRRIETTWALAERITGVSRNELARSAENAVRRVDAIRRAVGMPVLLERQPQTLVSGLDEDQAAALRAGLEEMVGASVQPAHRRRYPFGAAACHLVGTLGAAGPDATDLPATAPASLQARLTGYFEGDLVGKSGAERLCEDMLRGRRGYLRVRRTGGVMEEVPARFGQDVHLTIDIELQTSLAAALGQPGAIVVLDVPSGEVLAMVSLPGYDLNEYRRQADQLHRDTLDLPLLNRAVSARYPPGSSVKPIVALAALTENVITPATVFECRGYLYRPDQFKCFRGIRHGSLTVLNAIERSCNVFFYNVGERLGVRRMDEWFARFGYGEVPGTGLAGECPGLLPGPRATRYAGDARSLAVGQGPIAVAPLHVANAVATIARGGVWLSPVVVGELADRQQERRLQLRPEHLDLVRQGMYLVVNSPSGTAYKTARHEQVEICGKTGTAETPPVWMDANGNGRVDEGEQVLKSGDTAWFVGYAPARNPQIAFAVVIEYSQQPGGAVCGPIGKQVVELCRQFGYVK